MKVILKFIYLSMLVFSFQIFGQTPDQIKQARRIIKEKGLTEQQVINAAKAKGYSDTQIESARQKVNKTSQNSEGATFETEREPLRQEITNNSEIEKTNELPAINEEELEIIDESLSFSFQKADDKYFGYDIFLRDPSVFQGSSFGAVDPDYLIGPGDEIIVMLWGETQFRQELIVDREGFIFIPDIGQVFVNGLNLNLLESKLFRVLSQSYASLSPQSSKATTFLDVSLGNLRPLRIQVLGAVAQPGAYTVSPSATIFSSLYYFNGPTTLGSLRDIKLIRGGDEISKIDFYDYLLTGKKPKDEKLQLDDVIFIPNRLKTVIIRGEINRPGIYELKDKETLKDILEMAGGLKITAYLDRAQIDRIVPFDKRESQGMDRMFSDVNLNDVLKSNGSFQLQDGDRIEIYSVMDIRQNIVVLTGAVSRPGSYDIGDSLYLADLIQKADGISGDAYLDRIDIVRIKPDYSEELIKLNLKKVLENDSDSNIKLQSLDKITIYGMTEMVPKNYVSINGHVKRPGKYQLQENMTLYDLIFKSGGFIDEKFKIKTYLDRAELIRKLNKDGKQKIIPFNLQDVLNNQDIANERLRPNDYIKIYGLEEVKGKSRYVTIEGNVKRPDSYELIGNTMTIQDLLFIAGGFDDKEFKASTYLERADLLRLDENRLTRSLIRFDINKVLNNRSSVENIILEPEDKIVIYSKSQFLHSPIVKIYGSIRLPGTYQLKNGMNVKDLILEAGGIPNRIFEYKIEIARLNKDEVSQDYVLLTELEKIENLMSKSQSPEGQFLLMPFDEVFIRSKYAREDKKSVSVRGEVNYPGTYKILNYNEKISDLIERAGGLKLNAFPFGSSYIRNNKNIRIDIEKILKNPKSKYNISILDGDKIIIAHHPYMIEIKGEVNNEGFYKYQANKRIRHVLKHSGGLTPDAEKDNIYITYANGISKKYSPFFGNHKVFDGSIIHIGKKPDQEPFDITEYAKELTSIFANVAQVISILVIARN